MSSRSDLKECSFCVMDSTASNIEFDEHGRCNFCRSFESKLRAEANFVDEQKRERSLEALIAEVKKGGATKKYDCIVGVSGGLDSSWALVKAKELGLRPLAVHMDNGWNSELASNNIYHLVDILDVDLYTYVVKWSEYKNLMSAFFDSDVLDVELLYDNAMMAVCYQQARKYGIKYILSGSNTATEGLAMPKGWNWVDKHDARNIKSIARSKNVKIRSLPMISNWDLMLDRYFRKIQWVPFLDFLNYVKEETLEALVKDFKYKPYPYKHYENIFTRFYQGFILPKKFGIDKRRVHFSTLIVSGQMNKEEADEKLLRSPYPSSQELIDDREYFLKKMGWSESKLEAYIARPERSHDEWATDLVTKFLIPTVSPVTSWFRNKRGI